MRRAFLHCAMVRVGGLAGGQVSSRPSLAVLGGGCAAVGRLWQPPWVAVGVLLSAGAVPPGPSACAELPPTTVSALMGVSGVWWVGA